MAAISVGCTQWLLFYLWHLLLFGERPIKFPVYWQCQNIFCNPNRGKRDLYSGTARTWCGSLCNLACINRCWMEEGPQANCWRIQLGGTRVHGGEALHGDKGLPLIAKDDLPMSFVLKVRMWAFEMVHRQSPWLAWAAPIAHARRNRASFTCSL